MTPCLVIHSSEDKGNMKIYVIDGESSRLLESKTAPIGQVLNTIADVLIRYIPEEVATAGGPLLGSVFGDYLRDCGIRHVERPREVVEEILDLALAETAQP